MTAMAERVLMIEDDAALAALVRDYLTPLGFDIWVVGTAAGGLRRVGDEGFDAVILDVMLPDLDGFEVLRRIRSSSDVPVLMLTARGEDEDRIAGLEIGADDYLPKPFEPRELVARIQNVLRRSGQRADPAAGYLYDGLEVYPERRSALLDGEELDLTTMEFQLLALFAANPGKTYSRDDILNELRGIDAQLFSRSVDILVSRLRGKLNDTAKSPRFIKTVWGTGYTFIGEAAKT
jgi:DNA-binding response OmpR family regulator